MIDHKIEEALNIPVLQISEDNLSDDEDYESYAGGPSARRMKSHQKKKRRSGSLSRVFTGTFNYQIWMTRSCHKKSKESLMGVASLLSTFISSIMKFVIFGLFLSTELRDRTVCSPFLFWTTACCSNNIMQKMTFITPSIYKIVYWKQFSKTLVINLDYFQEFV